MTNQLDERDGMSRRSILVGGTVALVTLFVIGALVNVPHIQRDLRHRATARLAAAGFEARVDFIGQDGTLRCANPLTDAPTARRIAASVVGVWSLTMDPSCTTGVGVTPAPTSSTSATDTTVETSTSIATTTTTATATTATATTTTAPKKLVLIGLEGGRLKLQGAVATAAQQAKLRAAAARAVDPANLIDSFVVDATSAITDGEVAALATLMGAMSVPLSSGEIGRSDVGLYATGVYVDESARVAFERAATAAGVTPTLNARIAATAADATALENELNTVVRSSPILFRKGKAILDPASIATLQRVAGVAKRFSGLIIEVQGHTDSVGDPAKNQTLSEQRAQAVRGALAALGVPVGDLTAKGFGETQLVTGENGKEIPDASRRVVFGVTIR